MTRELILQHPECTGLIQTRTVKGCFAKVGPSMSAQLTLLCDLDLQDQMQEL